MKFYSKMKKSIFCVLFAVAVAIPQIVAAQDVVAEKKEDTPKRNDIVIWGLGGLSTLQYSPAVGTATLGFGGGGGVGVRHFFTQKFGATIGVEFMTYASSFNAPLFTTSYYTTDESNDPFAFKTRFVNYTEKQQMMSLSLPIMATYEHNNLYAQLGVKIGMKLNSKFSATADSAMTYASVADWNVDYFNLTNAGLKNYANVRNSGDINLGVSFIAISGEIGMKFNLSQKLNLYTGIYADYGFTDMAKSRQPMVNYLAPAPTELSHISVLNSSLSTSNPGTSNIVDRIGILGAGVKIALAISTHNASVSTTSTEQIATNTTVLKPAPINEEAEDKEARKQIKAKQEADEKLAKQREKDEKQLAKERANMTPLQREMYDDIEELKRVKEILIQQAETSLKNQEAILAAVKAAQEAAMAAAQAARTASEAVLAVRTQQQQSTKPNLAPQNSLLKPRAGKDINLLTFKVQISARRTKLDNVQEPFAKFGLKERVTEERDETTPSTFVYKYVVGSFNLIDDAIQASNELRERGIKDAFVVAYYKGKRITMYEALEMLEKR